MDKILSFVLILLAAFKVISSFVQDLAVGSLFGQEINIWLYRGIWLLVGILALTSLLRKLKKK